MDFRNICSKFDMDAIKAKIPPLPDVLTQFKLPKSIGKLKARSKIFRSSRENVATNIKPSSSKEDVTIPMGGGPSLAVPSSADFVNHTPQRISTISSLVDQKGVRSRPPAASIRRKNAPQSNETFYHSAGGIDDYCPTPPRHTFNNSIYDISPMSPKANIPPEEETQKSSFVNRMQKGYKDVSDFKLKHIFVKKTVVRQDNISLHQYIDQYADDRKSQERHDDKLDRAIAENYAFEFKTSRRKSVESFGISTPSDSPTNAQTKRNAKKLLSEHSGDESGMEHSPPNRKPGIAATRFARVRKVPLQMSLDEDDNINQMHANYASVDNDDEEEEEEEEEVVTQTRNTLPTVRRQRSKEDQLDKIKPSPPKSKSFKQRLSTLTRQAKPTENKDTPKKRRAPLSPQESAEVPSPGSHPSSPPENKPAGKQFGALKENIKRFQKSFKLSTASLAQSGTESAADEANDKTKTSKTQQFAERLKRFRSVENVDRQQTEDDQEHEGKTSESPMHRITIKLLEWKKSIRKKTPTQNTEDEDGYNTSPQKRDKPVGSLMKKLKHMRSRKNQSTDDPDEDEEGGATYREGFRERAKLQLEKGVAAASQMPQMTMDKLKETRKYFRKTQDKNKESKPKQKTSTNDSDESDLEETSESSKRSRPHTKVNTKAKDSVKTGATRHYYSSDDEDEEDEDDEYDHQHLELCKVTSMEPHQPKVLVPLARAAWTTKSIHSDSIDTADDDDMLPRVLLHQNNSDAFESTIIIAVTRPMSRSHSPSPFITELPPDSPKASSPETKADNWVPHRDIVSGFRENSAPIKRQLSKDTITSNSTSKGHSRKHSMDSSSDDSWMKDIPRGISTAIGLNIVSEMDEPWKAQAGKKNQSLYKSKSIDIFEKTQGGLKIFEDFDDELKYTPVVKIEKTEMEANKENSLEQDSGEELEDNADDDNSSRVTRILKQPAELKTDEKTPPPVNARNIKLKTHLYGNSAESLMGHLDAKNNSDEDESDEENVNEDNEDVDEDEENNEDDEEEDESDEVDNRPPSVAPSPPPAMPSSPPPPLPQRQPSIRLSKLTDAPLQPQHPPPPPPPPEELPPSPPKTQPPAMPQSKPPLPPNRAAATNALPKVPERTPSMSRVAKPLVKTSSLRLTYDEQVNPNDVGKVNKLISKFEPKGSSVGRRERPRLIPRIPIMSQSSEDYSEDEEDDEEEEEDESDSNQINNNRVQTNVRESSRELSLEKTPTNKPNKPKMQKSFSIDADGVPLTPVNNNSVIKEEMESTSAGKLTKSIAPIAISVTVPPAPPRERAPLPPLPYIPSISISCLSLQSDQNSNFSQASSEYGSPMTYPSSRIGSNEVTPQSSPKDVLILNSNRRSRRSMTRDDERYFSFDSDEENSYYSISSSKSSRYVVDL